jgi:DNA polymerase-3 subunit delta
LLRCGGLVKLEAGRVEGFLRAPGAASVVLIYGPDGGLVSERAVLLAKAVAGGTDDAFRYAEISDAGRLLEEAMASSLMGGRRVVRLRDAGESAVKAMERVLAAAPDALVILEGGDLTPKSKLRALAEKHPQAVAIACYTVDAGRLPRVVTDRLRAAGVSIEADAAAWVANNILGEEGAIRQAVELLTLYAGAGKRLELADVSAALADGGESTIQEAVDAALTGDPAATDRAMTLAYEEGVSPVALVRVLLGELMRLRVLADGMRPGGAAEAVSQARPPVFFKRAPTVTKMLSMWPEAALGEAIKSGLTAEIACKTTHVPDAAYCRQMFLGLASRARRAGRR